MKYHVVLRQTRHITIEIEAKSKKEALRLALEQGDGEEIDSEDIEYDSVSVTELEKTLSNRILI